MPNLRPATGILAAVTVVCLGCTPGHPTPENGGNDDAPAAEQPAAGETGSTVAVIDVVAREFSFRAPDSVPSGWTTFRLHNEGEQTHLVLLTRLPEGKTIEDFRTEVGPPFAKVWDELRAGSVDKAQAAKQLGGSLPDWYLSSARYTGGPGLVAPGRTGQTTVHLDPGYYIVECYAKTADGTFHGDLGMVRALTVTSEESDTPEPQADLHVTLTNDRIELAETPTAGEHTIAVRFQEQQPGGQGNDVHLARLEPDTDLDALARWMDWMNVEGLQSPAPATFLGGAQDMAAGATEFFTATLEPGRYAWIAEPVTGEGKLQVFTVE